MAGLEDDQVKGGPATDKVAGFDTILVAPNLLPTIGRVLRPAAKAAIKGAMIAYDEVASIAGSVNEVFAEAAAELEEEDRGQAVETGPGADRSNSARARSSQPKT